MYYRMYVQSSNGKYTQAPGDYKYKKDVLRRADTILTSFRNTDASYSLIISNVRGQWPHGKEVFALEQ